METKKYWLKIGIKIWIRFNIKSWALFLQNIDRTICLQKVFQNGYSCIYLTATRFCIQFDFMFVGYATIYSGDDSATA